jgi:valyl-tRNA synthetase
MIVTESRIKPIANFARLAVVLAVVVFANGLSGAQNAQQSSPIIPPADKDKIEQDTPASLEETMRVKRAIRAAEKEYQENVDRARDLSVLGEAVNASFKQNASLGRDDIKKLEKAEKLAKAIRNAAGGSEDDNEIEQPPKDLADALCMLAEMTASLKKNVEKTPKHVISATVIDEANALLELTRIVRTLIPNH